MKTHPDRIFLGYGANLGDRAAAIESARALLGRSGWEETAFSGLYETPPWGNVHQPAFLNAVSEGCWSGSPLELLRLAMQIEDELGRVRQEAWGPRAIDIDILSFGEMVTETQRLSLPHPHLDRRAFVLVPWAELAPDFLVPKFDKTVVQMRDALPAEELSSVLPYDPEWEDR